MGLDVYLHKCADLDAARKREAEAERRTSELWLAAFGPEEGGSGKRYDSAGEKAQKSHWAKCRKVYKEMGLDEHGSDPNDERIEMDSKTRPDHLFKVGYFRSSYNGSGFNSHMDRLKLATLYDIFPGSGGDARDFVPDWDVAAANVARAIEEHDRAMASDAGKYDVTAVADPPTMERAAKSEEDAREKFLEKARQDHGPYFREFSCLEGDFFLDGIKIYAAIPGEKYGRRCTYIVFDAGDEAGKWYGDALRIVAETIDYVRSHPERDKFFMVWSG